MEYRLALVGFGGVARALVDVIKSRSSELKKQYGIDLTVVGISDMRLGMIVDPDGLDLDAVLAASNRAGGFADYPGGGAEPDNKRIVELEEVDIVVEATFTNPDTGEPAVSHCRWALERGKHVVTTNKGPIALALGELEELSAKFGGMLEYEGSVMSGTPVIRLARNNLAGSGVTGFRGILNGTANFVLGMVEDGIAFDDAVAMAQELGYAEADPTADLEGFDVLMKVIILSNELFGCDLTEQVRDKIARTGISGLNADDVRSAKAQGKCWKLIGQGSLDENGVPALSVQPQCLPASDPLAGISGPTNAITFETDLLGGVTISGPGAGRQETAFALLSDILAINSELKSRASRRHQGL